MRFGFYFILIFGLTGVFQIARARVTDFSGSHRGIKVGSGYFVNGSAGMDPVPQLLDESSTAQGTADHNLVPIQLGIFADLARVSIEARANYLSNTGKTWGITGSAEGAGSSSYSSYGAGLQISIPIKVSSGFRVSLYGAGDYYKHRLQLKFAPPGDVAEQKLKLSGASVIASGGLMPEFWLGDLWILSLNIGYARSASFEWKSTDGGSLFHRTWAKGSLTSPSTGEAITGVMQSFFLGAGFKLAFY